MSNRATKFSGAELALLMCLEIVDLLGVRDFLRILYGLSIISGGFGLG